MTHAERNAAIVAAAKRMTAKNLASKSLTDAALYATGMYTRKGELRVSAGGKRS